MIKAVVFDMDGIMFDTERQGQEAILAVGKELGMPDIETFSVECLAPPAPVLRRISPGVMAI